MKRLGILGFAAWLLVAALPAQAQQVNLYCNTGSGLTAWQPASAANPCPVNATASISGFPGTQTTGTPISVTTGGVSGTLPSGTEVVATNVGTTNAAYCKLGASATTSDQYIAPNGGWFGFTVGSATQLTCITSTSTTTVNMVGGSGIPTGTGGGGGSSGGGGAVTIADGADVAQGTTTDAACATDNGTCTEVALIKRNNQRLTTLNTTLGSPFQVGGSIGNTTFAATQGTAANLNATVVGTGTFVTQSAIVAGGNTATVKAASTAPAATDPALVVSISPNSVNANGQATMANSAPVVIASNQASIPVAATLGAETTKNIGTTSQLPYPSGATPYTATATGTTGATTATLAGASSVTTYLCGFSIRSNATAVATGNATVTGVITATLNFTHWTAPNASGIGLTEMIFQPCVPASGTNQSVAVISPAPGTGGVVSVTAWGYKL